jgi:hypothetical protein
MDVGFYLGELLMQQGEVKVPGLGNFSQVRMSAYYDENEELFYPPFNKVHFEPQADVDNDDLAEYLVAKKNISISSAKYFIEKYIANLRLQAIVADVPLGHMGFFYTDRAELSFKPSDRLIDDSELYGYVPVKINKANAIPAYQEAAPVPEIIYPLSEPEIAYPQAEPEQTKPEPEQTKPEPEQTKPEPEQTEIIEEEYIEPVAEEKIGDLLSSTYDEAFLDLPEEEEEGGRGPLRGILIALVVVAVLAVGVLTLYMYAPATFNKLQFWKKDQTTTTPAVTRPNTIVIPALDSPDTESTDTTLNDSTGAVAADTVAKARFELITGKGFKSLWAADQAVKKYRAMGLTNAKLAEERPGKLTKISLGTFNSISESEAFKQKLIKEGKLNKHAYTIEIPQN